MDPPVDAVDDHADTVAELVGELLVDQASNDGRTHLLTMQAEAFGATLLAAGGKRPVDCLDDVAAFAELAHGRFELIRECPHPWLKLAREPIALERLQAADPQRPIEVPMALAGLGPQVEHSFLRLRKHGAVNPRQALG